MSEGYRIRARPAGRVYEEAMVDRYTNWTEQTDFPDGFADCEVLMTLS